MDTFINDAWYKATIYLNGLTNFKTILTVQLFLKVLQNIIPLSKYYRLLECKFYKQNYIK